VDEQGALNRQLASGLLHKLAPEPLRACLEKPAQCDLPNLWKPRPDQFFRAEALP